MTAIFGILGEADRHELEAMAHRLAHRGACFEIWEPAPGVHLGVGHRSSAELTSSSGLPIALDGVIENGAALEAAGECPACSGRDNRLLVNELYRRHQLDALAKLRGGFAVAIWDDAAARLVLAVDFFGMRSLLFTKAGDRWIFASELKALLAVADVASAVDPWMIRNANSKHSMNRYTSCIAGVLHVPPGQWVALSKAEMKTERFWQPHIAVQERSDAEHVRDFRDTFVRVIERKLAAHDRIGIAVSAGIDSAMVVGGIRHVAPDRTLHTFCTGLGRDDPELIGAAEIAHHYRTIHHEYIFDVEEIPEWLPIFAWHLEHPYGREDMIASYCTAVAASGHVDVLFGGYAAENLVGGMPRHLLIHAAQRLPFLRPVIADLYQYPRASLPPRTWLGRQLLEWYVKGTFPPPPVLGTTPLADEEPLTVLPEMRWFKPTDTDPFSRALLDSLLGTIENTEFDRLHQAAGVLVDSPFYDPDLIACSFRIPDRLKIRGVTQKYVQRAALNEFLPPDMVKRPKTIISFRRDIKLADILESLGRRVLSDAAVRERGLFDIQYVGRAMRREAGQPYPKEQFNRLWSIVLTEIWCRIFVDQRGEFPATPLW
jgi:asparagine synthase (glutamine-hydrolysing)